MNNGTRTHVNTHHLSTVTLHTTILRGVLMHIHKLSNLGEGHRKLHGSFRSVMITGS